MRNNKIYLMALFVSIGLLFNSCDINSEETQPGVGVDSFQSTSTSLTIDTDSITYDVVVVTSEPSALDRSVGIEASGTGSGIDYNFTGNVVIPAGELTASTLVKFNYDPIPLEVLKTLVLTLTDTPSEEITVEYTKVCTPNLNEIEVAILFDNFSDETSWEITDAGGAVVASSGGIYPGGMTTYNETFTFPDGTYTFTIFDSPWADGICCSYGNGSYAVNTTCGVSLLSGGEFGAFESTTFTLPI